MSLLNNAKNRKEEMMVVLKGIEQFQKELYNKWPLLAVGEEKGFLPENTDDFFWQMFFQMQNDLLDSKTVYLKKVDWTKFVTVLHHYITNGKKYFEHEYTEEEFKSALQMIRSSWQSQVDLFIPDQYKEIFVDQEGLVSVIESPYDLLALSKAHSNENLLNQYRRWLARRDWFLGNLGLLVLLYRNDQHFSLILPMLDEAFTAIDIGYIETDNFKLPARILENNIPIHITWDKKTMPSLLFKILRRDYIYNSNDTNIFANIYDILRARIVTKKEYIDQIKEIIKKNLSWLEEKDRRNQVSAQRFRVVTFIGEYKGQRLELQIQDLESYYLAEHSSDEANHLWYKAKQFYQLLHIFLPPIVIQKIYDFDYRSDQFKEEFIEHIYSLLD